MPEKVTKIDASQDPATTKQYDNESSAEKKFTEFYELVDKLNIAMMGTYRNGVGVCCLSFTPFLHVPDSSTSP